MTQAGERGVMTEEPSDVGAGWVLFAAIVMIVGGLFAFFEGPDLRQGLCGWS